MKKLLAICMVAVVVAATQVAHGDEVVKKEVIASPNAPKAIGAYSQAIRYGNLVFLTQIPIDPKTQQPSTGTIEEQTKLVFENLKAVLEAAGLTFSNVLSTDLLPEKPGRLLEVQRRIRHLLPRASASEGHRRGGAAAEGCSRRDQPHRGQVTAGSQPWRRTGYLILQTGDMPESVVRDVPLSRARPTLAW